MCSKISGINGEIPDLSLIKTNLDLISGDNCSIYKVKSMFRGKLVVQICKVAKRMAWNKCWGQVVIQLRCDSIM